MVNIRVGATSANIGPGFDSIGVALNLYNTLSFEESDECVVISGDTKETADENNIFIKSVRTVYELCGKPFYGVTIKQKASIPPARGLGSSSACICASVAAANEMLKSPLKRDDLINLAASLEGHPDNTTPCIAGGVCFCVMENDRVVYNRVNAGRNLMFCAFVPNFRMQTSKSRKLIPDTIEHTAAAFNVSRASLLASVFYSHDYEKLAFALGDKMHQPYRMTHIKDYDKICAVADELSAYGTYLSGAGPTIMALVDANDKTFTKRAKQRLNELELSWRVIPLFCDPNGIKIIR